MFNAEKNLPGSQGRLRLSVYLPLSLVDPAKTETQKHSELYHLILEVNRLVCFQDGIFSASCYRGDPARAARPQPPGSPTPKLFLLNPEIPAVRP